MATYDVIAPGFIDGITHTPEHKTRNVVITDVPFEKVPAWLKLRSGKEMPPLRLAGRRKKVTLKRSPTTRKIYLLPPSWPQVPALSNHYRY